MLDEAGENDEGGILAIPVADTLKRADGSHHIDETVARAGLWQAQTPQLFQTALLNRALSVDDLSEITDEASAVEKLGIRPRLVQGDTRNLKIDAAARRIHCQIVAQRPSEQLKTHYLRKQYEYPCRTGLR